ncbi:MAG: TolC family protein [Alphaproteobacteria bacterium]|uniref:efflux transporter outer membrane subunit n=1 Tax=Brevundimonas sp. TaxID=1871086 RepID=UPI0011FF6E0D|nr:TolC family protein [Alphaproteobacteria bacterium]MBU2163076.1 TolC family protein [Alphaproteobacteria bacterium]MBU2231725.1 TolC family protein [Alphaproteobacteria bacterium]TAJ43309.1 MAG: TolC family protein [Brevundimonas sp.]
MRRHRFRAGLPAAVGLGLTLAACATAPVPSLPGAAVEAPATWRAGIPESGATVEAGWWSAFGDPRLTALVEQALATNADLAIAEARVREAGASAAGARAALTPSVDIGAGVQDQRRLTDLGIVTETLAAQPEVRIGYEVDLWGRLRNGDAAARAGLQASRHGRDAAALSVAAATARAYMTLLSLDAQLESVRDILENRSDALALMQRRVDAGYASQLDLARARAEHSNVAQRIPALELAVSRQENALRLLTGGLPGPVERSRLQDLRLPVIAPGLPSSLLARRPDIAQAESQLVAADAAFASARAALLPQVRLTAAAGGLFVERLDPISLWTLGSSVLAPLFDGGRREAQADAADARREQAAWAYRRAVLGAFSEAESALDALVRLGAQRARLSDQRDAAAEAAVRAGRLYDAGYVSHLDQFDAQRHSLEADLALIQVKEARLNAAIAVYQALGGGWTPDADQGSA